MVVKAVKFKFTFVFLLLSDYGLCHLYVLQACWMIHFFSEITFKDRANIQHALEQVSSH